MVTSVGEGIKWLIRGKEFVIKCRKEGILPFVFGKLWKIRHSDIITVQTFGLYLYSDSCLDWYGLLLSLLHNWHTLLLALCYLDSNRRWDVYQTLLYSLGRIILFLIARHNRNKLIKSVSEIFGKKTKKIFTVF